MNRSLPTQPVRNQNGGGVLYNPDWIKYEAGGSPPKINQTYLLAKLRLVILLKML
jgi:hypothetical protein